MELFVDNRQRKVHTKLKLFRVNKLRDANLALKGRSDEEILRFEVSVYHRWSLGVQVVEPQKCTVHQSSLHAPRYLSNTKITHQSELGWIIYRPVNITKVS